MRPGDSLTDNVRAVLSEGGRITGTWLSLDTGESGPIVDDSGISDSWDMATRDVRTDIEWTVSDDLGSDDLDVSVSAELLDTLLAKARAYDACKCACRRSDG